MKITSIEPTVISCKLDEAFSFSQWEYSRTKDLYCEDHHRRRGVWLGEGYGPAEVLHAAIRFFIPFIVGKDVLNIEGIWQEMYRRSMDYARRGIMVAAISAIDIALWDIKGKILGQPVGVLLGGRKRDAVQAYATGMYFRESNDLSKDLALEAARYREEGFDAMKMKVGLTIGEDIRNVSAVRNSVGDDIQLMVDANHAYSLNESLYLADALKEFRIAWFEEPLSPELYDAYAELRLKVSVPIAAGECEYLRAGFHHLFNKRCVDIAQPDICAAGGITEVKKISSMAQTFGVDLIPHSWGTGIAQSAALQLLSNTDITPGRMKEPNVLMEFDCTENILREKLVHPKIVHEKGMINVPDRPGLGIEVDEDFVQHYAIDQNHQNHEIRL